jgi:hypothetical protein
LELKIEGMGTYGHVLIQIFSAKTAVCPLLESVSLENPKLIHSASGCVLSMLFPIDPKQVSIVC